MNKQDDKTATVKKSNSPLWMKMLAPILSVIIWVAVITINDPITRKTIDDVSVATINTNVLDDVGQAYIVKSGDKISVTVTGKRSVVDKMTNKDIIATADFSEMV